MKSILLINCVHPPDLQHIATLMFMPNQALHVVGCRFAHTDLICKSTYSYDIFVSEME